MKKCILWFAAFVIIALSATSVLLYPARGQEKKKAGWKQLFNGKNLEGWDTWLTAPRGSKKLIGLNNDPQKVFTVVNVDGEPAIRISGQTFGALTSKRPYENYHLTLQFKWGEKKWPPREKAVRDSGLLYHCVGPHGGPSGRGPWMKSQECQIQENDCGDYYSVAGAIVTVEGVRKGKRGPVFYKKGGKKFTVPSKGIGARIVRKQGKYEKPHGQWNTIELYTVGGTSVHVVNGTPLMVLTNSRQIVKGQEMPLTGGKIQIQSEGAEVYYRHIAIRPIKQIPKMLLH